ncbi:MAG: alpha/beta fold hydrolase [Roseiflexaceae bacterium]|nr:alpha/beta fold hydrolase [Roseiflexaceae bacterium]
MHALHQGWLPVDGGHLYYETVGTGSALVFVHAGIADCRMWDAQFHVFAQHGHVVRYDIRGYGQSTFSDTPFAHRTDLLALLSQLNIDQATLLGVSLGGNIVLETALIAPARVKTLIVATSAPGGYQFTGNPPPKWSARAVAQEAGDWELAAELDVQLWLDGPRRTPGQVDAHLRDTVREMDCIALQRAAERDYLLQPFEPPTIERLRDINVPTLVIAGELDEPNILAACHVLSERIPKAQLMTMQGTAHLPNMEQPDTFNRIVLDFLQTI